MIRQINRAAFALLVWFTALSACAQARFNRTITFDGYPLVPPGQDIGYTYYWEDGMIFTPISPGEQFGRAGGGREGFPHDGTAYVLQGAFDTFSGHRDGGTRFGLFSADLAEFSILYDVPKTVQFIGYRPDGSTVTTEFTTDGIIDGTGPLADFETFYFDEQFADLVRFEVPSHGYALDNLVYFNVIPEPSAPALVLLAVGIRWMCKRRRSRPGG